MREERGRGINISRGARDKDGKVRQKATCRLLRRGAATDRLIRRGAAIDRLYRREEEQLDTCFSGEERSSYRHAAHERRGAATDMLLRKEEEQLQTCL